ncbi:MAG: sulfatase [Pirellulaceae bacterium]
MPSRHLYLVALLLATTPAVQAGDSVPSAPPNIVFILADDLGINDLACYGRSEHRTPHLDQLAVDGMRFTAAYCAQPICSASRAAILSGKSPARLHLTTFLPGRPDCPSQMLLHPLICQQLPLEETTLAEYLKAAGYATACIGKWHVGGAGFGPREQGFDIYHAGNAVTTPSATEGGKGEYDLTAEAEKFIAANRNRPFFLYLAHNSPHIPYTAKDTVVSANRVAFEPVYAAVIETLDDTVSQLLRRLAELGLASNTIVIFTSDNGGLHVPELTHARITHNTPYRAGKGLLYEGGLRVPLIVRWPGHVPAGRTVDAPVVNTDWLPTLLDCAGVSVPDNLDGVSLAGLLTGRSDAPQRAFVWHFPHYTNQGSRPAGAVRDGDWKFIQYYEDQQVELFNLADDVGETNNLAASEPERVAQLRSQLASWCRELDVQTNTKNPGADVALHRALYEDIDVSRYNPATASEASHERVRAWRKQMDAVVPRR